MSATPTAADVIKHPMQLRQTLVHALNQRNLSPKRFNDIRVQLLPLDEQLRNLGVDPIAPPATSAAYVIPTRRERRTRDRNKKFNSYEARLRQKLSAKLAQEDTRDAN